MSPIPDKTVAQEIRQVARVVDSDSRARTHLANERTFLAWLRTGLSLVALGMVVAQFLGGDHPAQENLAILLAILLIATGIVMAVMAGRRFVVARDDIDEGIYQSGSVAIWVSVALVAAIGAIALVFIVFLR